MTAPIRERARAKLNLDLHVLARRDDGYHEIDSLMAFTAFGDTVEIAAAPTLHLHLHGAFAAGLSAGDDNLAMKAARGLQALAGIATGASITIGKAIPVAAGLGGGSADAAAVLRGLCRLWAVTPPAHALQALARRIGADVPACLASRPVRARGIGEDLAPVTLPAAAVVLANPRLPLATATVFRELRPPFLAAPPGWMGAADAGALAVLLAGRRNDLEVPARAACPAVDDVLAALRAQDGCLLARMSGSGATCFGLFSGAGDAARAADQLGRGHPRWWVQATQLDNDGAAG